MEPDMNVQQCRTFLSLVELGLSLGPGKLPSFDQYY